MSAPAVRDIPSCFVKVLKDLPLVPEAGDLAVHALCGALEADMAALDALPCLFAGQGDDPAVTDCVVAALRGWHRAGAYPSLAAVSALACARLGRDVSAYYPAVMMSAVLGSVPHKANSYHNNRHFFEVLFQTVRMMACHNEMFAGSPRALTARDVGLLLIAACIHDFTHDGRGNTRDGMYVQARLEKQSFERAAPFLEQAGLTQDDRDALAVLLLSTDVSPLGRSSSFMRRMKAAYRFHFEGGTLPDLTEDMDVFEKDARLCDMALILHEADIATSAGLDYAVTQFETRAFRQEMGLDEARPSHILDFFAQVCAGQFLSPSGQALYGANMARITAQAEEDFKNGNAPFSPPQ